MGPGLAMVLAGKFLVGVTAVGLEVRGYRALDRRSHVVFAKREYRFSVTFLLDGQKRGEKQAVLLLSFSRNSNILRGGFGDGYGGGKAPAQF